MIKDALLCIGCVLEFPITRELLDLVGASWCKYEADRSARLQAEEEERTNESGEWEKSSSWEVSRWNWWQNCAVQVEYICCKWFDWFDTSKYQTSSWREKHQKK